jgi:hypothetical protein
MLLRKRLCFHNNIIIAQKTNTMFEVEEGKRIRASTLQAFTYRTMEIIFKYGRGERNVSD